MAMHAKIGDENGGLFDEIHFLKLLDKQIKNTRMIF